MKRLTLALRPRRILLLLTVAGLALWPAATSADDDNPIAVAAQRCQGSGYTQYVRSDGSPFANTGECITYVARGGTLHPATPQSGNGGVVLPARPVPPLSAAQNLCESRAGQFVPDNFYSCLGATLRPYEGSPHLEGELHLCEDAYGGNFTASGGNPFDYHCSQQAGSAPAPPAGVTRYFPETGLTVRGMFLAYWLAHGGLAINGFPLSAELVQTLEDGHQYTVQYFERVRLEYHPENQPPYDMLVGQFGRHLHPPDPAAAPLAGQAYFGATGHNLGGRFRDYWATNGALPAFGFPLSEEFSEQLEDGQTYTVQYFERARFEWHPENAPPYDVLVGQFGRRIMSEH